MKFPHEILIFTEYNAHRKRVEDVAPYLNIPNVLINPDLQEVLGTPQQYWKLEDGAVKKMAPEERERVDAYHAKFKGHQNQVILEKEVIREVEVIKEVVVEKIVEKIVNINVPVIKKEVVKSTPIWVHFTITFLVGIIAALLLNK